MTQVQKTRSTRRTFIARTLAGTAAALAGPTILSARADDVFQVGEAHVDTTPPKEI